MNEWFDKTPPVEPVDHGIDAASGVLLSVYRLDQIHPVISGNKWFKLKGYLEAAIRGTYAGILTYGGAYSNHIVATACACQTAGIKSIGIIRGEAPAVLSHTLLQARSFGMQLHFLSRGDYAARKLPPELTASLASYYLVPEGGYGEKGVLGFGSAMERIHLQPYTHIICAVGTGTMIAGIAHATKTQEILGINVVNNGEAAVSAVRALLPQSPLERLQLLSDYHFGGYARSRESLFRFMNEWHEKTAIPTDFVYTGKMFFGIRDLLQRGYFPSGSHVLAIHSGGLQGNQSLSPGILRF